MASALVIIVVSMLTALLVLQHWASNSALAQDATPNADLTQLSMARNERLIPRFDPAITVTSGGRKILGEFDIYSIPVAGFGMAQMSGRCRDDPYEASTSYFICRLVPNHLGHSSE